jgi:hypothetical protein
VPCVARDYGRDGTNEEGRNLKASSETGKSSEKETEETDKR